MHITFIYNPFLLFCHLLWIHFFVIIVLCNHLLWSAVIIPQKGFSPGSSLGFETEQCFDVAFSKYESNGEAV